MICMIIYVYIYVPYTLYIYDQLYIYKSYYVCIYIVHVMHPSLLLSLLLFTFFDKAKYFEACFNNKLSLFFPFTAYCCL